MKKTFNIITGSAIVATLLAATPALAFSGSDKANGGFGLGIHLAPIARFFNEGKVNTDRNNQEHRDSDHDSWKFNNNTVGSTSVSFGTVGAVNGSTFVVDPQKFGATTTVTTNTATVFKTNGGATTSAAVQSGARVIVVGTTTATSTSGNSVTASIVIVLQKIGDFCKHMFWH